MSLPTPGPGRPHYPSYSEPQRGIALADLLLLVLLVVTIGVWWDVIDLLLSH